MWKLVYDSWNEQWIIAEFSRSDALDEYPELFHFRADALEEASRRNDVKNHGGEPFWSENDDTE